MSNGVKISSRELLQPLSMGRPWPKLAQTHVLDKAVYFIPAVTTSIELTIIMPDTVLEYSSNARATLVPLGDRTGGDRSQAKLPQPLIRT